MRISMKNKLLLLFTLMLVMGVFLFAGTRTAFAAIDIEVGASFTKEIETLSVDEVWLTGDMLHITVTDKDGGEKQNLELNLSDYTMPGDEYVTIKATDSSGRVSNAIQFRNPYYTPQDDTGYGDGEYQTLENGSIAEPVIPDGENPTDGRPFTPEGTGTVVDNATDGDGKEFFTVETPDGNVFYLIVDRQRNTDNVYLLGAVTEDDLASLAKPGDSKNAGIAEPLPTATPSSQPETTSEPSTPPAPAKSSGGNTGTILFIVIAIIVTVGTGYYLKIVRPKQNDDSAYDGGDEQGEFDDNEELEVNDEDEGDDEE